MLFESLDLLILTDFSDRYTIKEVISMLYFYLIIVSSAYLNDIALCLNFTLFILHQLSDEVDDNLLIFLNFRYFNII